MLTAQALREIEDRSALGELRNGSPVAFATAANDVSRLLADRKALVDVIKALQWKSIDKDNMEFECRVTCYEMDVIRAIIQEDR